MAPPPYWILQPHSFDTPHAVGLLWKSDRPESVTSTYLQTNIHPTGRTQTRNPSKRATTDPRLIPRVPWDQLNNFFIFTNFGLNDNSIITELRSARPSVFDFQKRQNYMLHSPKRPDHLY
jgi:hypothetical protein